MTHSMIYFFLAIEWFVAAILIFWVCKSETLDKLNDKILDFFKKFRKD